MEWLSQNWFWLVIFVIFMAMHLFGHQGHGGHGGGCGGGTGEDEGKSSPRRGEDEKMAGHRH